MSNPIQNYMQTFDEAPLVELGGSEIAGEPIYGEGKARLLNVGDGVMAVYLEMASGYENRGHSHPDHESLGFIVDGELRMTVGDQTTILRQGDTWFHPRGVTHSCLAPDGGCVAVEFHSPLRPDLLTLFGVEIEENR